MLGTPTFASNVIQSFPPPPDSGEPARGFLYKISKNGEEVGHFFATPQLTNAKMVKLNPQIWDVLGKSTKIFFQTASGTPALPPPPEDIETLLIQSFPILINRARQMGLPEQQIQRYGQGFTRSPLGNRLQIYSSLIQTLFLTSIGAVLYRPDQPIPFSLDRLIQSYSYAKRKPIEAIPVDYSVTPPPPPNPNEVNSRLNEQIESTKKVFASWIEGNEESFSDAFHKMASVLGVREDGRSLPQKIKPILRKRKPEDSFFFCLSAPILIGKNASLFNELRSEGWKIERV